ncbi:MAG: two-component system response regulator [Rhodospirillaceae bacterium]|nr:two-component system response regulator [Rhodospirillaceae bacterium]
MHFYDLSKISVILVDDNHHALELVKTILRSIGVQHIDAFDNAESAYEALTRAEYDVMIVDWVMRPVDGLQLVSRLRKVDSPCPFVPILMLTGYTQEIRVMRARDAGVTEVLKKPVSVLSLHNRLVSIIEHPRPFIRNKTFFGPDRRRREEERRGPDRRSSETVEPVEHTADRRESAGE